MVASERFRPYLPGRLLPVLAARFRDDTAEALHLPRPVARPVVMSPTSPLIVPGIARSRLGG